MTDATPLQRGDQVPHFEVRTVGGDVFSYNTIWQQRNLVLITLAEPADDGSYPSALAARASDFDQHESTCVITRERVPGVPTPGALVADRWGEIVHVTAAPQAAALPAPSELLDWLDYVERRCPECEGEAR